MEEIEVKENAKKVINEFAVLRYENEKRMDTEKAKFYKDALYGAKIVA